MRTRLGMFTAAAAVAATLVPTALVATVSAAERDVSTATQAPSVESTTAQARPCGQSTHVYRGPTGQIQEVAYYWRNCLAYGPGGDYIKIIKDAAWDEHMCVPAGETMWVGSDTPHPFDGGVQDIVLKGTNANC